MRRRRRNPLSTGGQAALAVALSLGIVLIITKWAKPAKAAVAPAAPAPAADPFGQLPNFVPPANAPELNVIPIPEFPGFKIPSSPPPFIPGVFDG